MKMKHKILTLFCAAVLCLGMVAVSSAAEDAAEIKTINSECPISGKALGDAVSTVEVGVCCKKCKGKFSKAPGKFLAKAAAATADACLFSGKPAKTTATVTVGFCCNNCKGKFDKDPQGNLGKVKPTS
ncbi:MAG: YHS domain-containing protein [Rhodothermales bacterium]|jgi:YHS domain-containing protein